MKFEVSAKEFKSVIDRAMAVVYKKPVHPMLRCVKIEAKENSVVVSATDLNQFVSIGMNAKVLEDGVAFVDVSNVVKVCSLTGIVTISADDKIFSVKNDSKYREVPNEDYKNDYVKFPQNDVEKVFSINKSELIESFGKLECMLSKENRVAVLQGFNIDGKFRRIVACNGYVLGIRKMQSASFSAEDFSFTIPGFIAKSIKKIANGKDDYPVEAYFGKPSNCKHNIVFIVGDDFIYSCGTIDGNFFDIERIIKEEKTCKFCVDANEVGSVAKEYMKVSKGSKTPSFMCFDKKSFCMSVVTPEYKTVDKINCHHSNFPELMIGINPEYVSMASNLFEGVFEMGVKSKVDPVSFEDEEWFAIVLPVLFEPNLADKVMDLMSRR